MENSYKYFENRACKYYPCHTDIEDMNCLFCYCPLYSIDNCPGNCKYVEIDGKKVKDCMDCKFPHRAENYEVIMQILSGTD